METAIRLRDNNGRYVQILPEGWEKKQPIYQKAYLKSNPWAKHWIYAKGRAKKFKREFDITVPYLKELWERDNAGELKAPSIDRINPNKGYTQGNCRFIERSLNISLGNKGMRKIKVCPKCGWHNQ